MFQILRIYSLSPQAPADVKGCKLAGTAGFLARLGSFSVSSAREGVNKSGQGLASTCDSWRCHLGALYKNPAPKRALLSFSFVLVLLQCVQHEGCKHAVFDMSLQAYPNTSARTIGAPRRGVVIQHQLLLYKATSHKQLLERRGRGMLSIRKTKQMPYQGLIVLNKMQLEAEIEIS